jgi:hypothetical protein
VKNRGFALGSFVFLVLVLLACKRGGTVTNAQLGTLLRKPTGHLAIKAPATRLPRVAARKGDIAHSFGVCFDYTQGEQLGKMEVVVRPPAPIKTLRLTSGQKSEAGEVRLSAPHLRGSGRFCQDMYFDADDPLGNWGFELQRDRDRIKAWTVEVYQP